jgi:anti-sigma factor RsiW
MDRCADIRARLALYFDEELEGGERASFERHVRGCEACSALVSAEREFLDDVRRVQPLYTAPDALRARVEKLISEAPPIVAAPASLKQRIQASIWRVGHVGRMGGVRQLSAKPSAPAFHWRLAVVAMFILALPVTIWLLGRNNNSGHASLSGPSQFALMAAETHLRHTRGQLPLEITSNGPDEISAWFTNKVGFSVKLPNYQDASGQEKLYRLEGARLVGYKDDYAAYVAYQMRTRPIGLVITSAAIAEPAGGEEIKAKGLTFHYDSIQGLKVITWSDRGLTYALVSDLDQRGQESCVVCHQGASDQDFIAPLKSN